MISWVPITLHNRDAHRQKIRKGLFQVLANWGSILSFIDKMNYESLHPKSRRVKALNIDILLKVFSLKSNIEMIIMVKTEIISEFWK